MGWFLFLRVNISFTEPISPYKTASGILHFRENNPAEVLTLWRHCNNLSNTVANANDKMHKRGEKTQNEWSLNRHWAQQILFDCVNTKTNYKQSIKSQNNTHSDMSVSLIRQFVPYVSIYVTLPVALGEIFNFSRKCILYWVWTVLLWREMDKLLRILEQNYTGHSEVQTNRFLILKQIQSQNWNIDFKFYSFDYF